MTKRFEELSQREKNAHWRSLETMIRNALAIVEAAIEPSTVSTIEDYLAHNELGLALEIMEDGIEQSKLPLTKELLDHLNHARRRMGYPALEKLEESP